MNIGIDGNEANVKNRVGVNKYAYEILKGIHKLLPENSDLIVHIYLREKPLKDMPSENKRFKYHVLSGGKVWILTRLTPRLVKNPERLSVFFSPSHYTPIIFNIPVISSIMDLGYLEFSGQFTKYDFWQLKYWTAISINRSKYLLTISEATQKDIVRRYRRARQKVVVTYPGYDEYLTTKKISDTQITKVKNKYSIVSDYILYLGTLKPSKNIEGLIKAYATLQDKDIQLVIAGKKGWLYSSIFDEVKKLGLTDKIIFTDFVDEVDKYPLIKGAKVFALPSFWEGFGLDILSAFALQVPVVASNVGSLPEVVGNAGFLVESKDVNSIAKGLKEAVELNKLEYNSLMKKAKEQLKKFSWTLASKRTLETIRKAAV